MPDLGSLTAVAVYAVVCGLVFAECGLLIGFLLPGDTVLFAAGLLAAHPASDVSVAALAPGAFVAAVLGEALGYAVGRRLGRPLVERRAGRFLNPANLERAERFYERYGWVALVAARFIPWVRTLAPLLAGAARMPARRFWTANLAGALVWAAGLIVLGYYAAEIPALRRISLAVAGLFVGWSAVEATLRWRASRHQAGRTANARR